MMKNWRLPVPVAGALGALLGYAAATMQPEQGFTCRAPPRWGAG